MLCCVEDVCYVHRPKPMQNNTMRAISSHLKPPPRRMLKHSIAAIQYNAMCCVLLGKHKAKLKIHMRFFVRIKWTITPLSSTIFIFNDTIFGHKISLLFCVSSLSLNETLDDWTVFEAIKIFQWKTYLPISSLLFEFKSKWYSNSV